MDIKQRKIESVIRCNPEVNDDSSPMIEPFLMGYMRLLTYNIQVGNNTRQFSHYITRSWQHILPYKGRIINLQKIAQLIQNYDLVALQEVDGGSLRSAGINQVEYLAKMAHFPYWHQQLNRNLGKFAQHSNGMLSRLIPMTIEDHALPGVKGRGAIFTRFGEGENALIVVMMHLALSKSTRMQQLAYIYNLIAPYRYKILMGDMNAELIELLDYSSLKNLNLITPLQAATYPSWNPKRGLDHILLSPELQVEQVNVLDALISDHLPIEVKIKLPNLLLENIIHFHRVKAGL